MFTVNCGLPIFVIGASKDDILCGLKNYSEAEPPLLHEVSLGL